MNGGDRGRSAAEWIECLSLEPHPEGGYYAETYRSRLRIGACCLGSTYTENRSACTSIYYLLETSQFSALHRLRSDELWHYHFGSTLTIDAISEDGEHIEIRLGTRIDQGERPQALIPAGMWFGARVREPESYTLVGCIVAPGFEFQDMEMGRREELIRRFPAQRGIIEKLTR